MKGLIIAMLAHTGLPLVFLIHFSRGLLWFHIASDSLIALAYFLIPVVLVRSVRGCPEIPVNGAVFCIGAFVVACGVTDHVIEVVTVLHPAYWIGGVLKTVTVVLAGTIFVILLRWMPAILAIPSHAELKENFNQRTASILENSTVCVVAANNRWRISYMNSNAAKLLKVEGEFLDADLWDLFPGQRASERTMLLSVMETRQPTSYEGYYLPLDLSSTVQVHPWDDGGIAVFFSDVSEQKRLQRALEKERAQRQQRVEVLAQFSAGIAHEIKNPLAIIHARASDLAELAAENAAVSAAMVEKACDSIVETADRAIRILRGLEALAHDGSQDDMQEAEPGDMVEAAVDLVRRRYETHGIALETSVPEGLPAMECCKVQIGQVLMNLLNNAFDAVEGSAFSQCWVRVEVALKTDAKDAREWICINVFDGGPPLAQETREHLMEAFYTTKAAVGGTGIGLSISREIAEKHGGSLELQDCDGQTCFHLALPVCAARKEAVAA